MATTTIPDELRYLFDEPVLGHVSYLNRRGQIVTFPMWIDFDGEHVLVSSPVGSRKGRSLRERGQVAVSVVGAGSAGRWVSVSGRVVDIQPDHDLAFIDRMSRKYLGADYQLRAPREIFTIAIDRVSVSGRELRGWARSRDTGSDRQAREE